MKKTTTKKSKKKSVKVAPSKTKTKKKVKVKVAAKSKKILKPIAAKHKVVSKAKSVKKIKPTVKPIVSRGVLAVPIKSHNQLTVKIDFGIVKSILISQPKPESDKNSYFYLTSKYKVEINFLPFIHLQGIDAISFRKYKINLTDYQAVIFTSRNAIDHFFNLCDDMRVKMSQETKYYCMTEAIALYMQKYILYRKRKVFFGDGTLKGLSDSIMKHRDGEKYLVPCSDNYKSEIGEVLKKLKFEYREAPIFKTVPVKILPKEINKHDMIVFFSPAGVNALLHNIPNFRQGKKVIGGFGPQTALAIVDAGLRLDLKAPSEIAPSMSMAIDKFMSRK